MTAKIKTHLQTFCCYELLNHLCAVLTGNAEEEPSKASAVKRDRSASPSSPSSVEQPVARGRSAGRARNRHSDDDEEEDEDGANEEDGGDDDDTPSLNVAASQLSQRSAKSSILALSQDSTARGKTPSKATGAPCIGTRECTHRDHLRVVYTELKQASALHRR